MLFPDGTIYIEPLTEPPAEVLPVPKPDGTITEDGKDYAVVKPDHNPDERGEQGETNATNPDRPVDADGFWATLWRLLTGYRVSPQGKIIVQMDRGNGPLYWQMLVDFCGQRNADALKVDGNGYFDTSNEWGMMCSPSGGDLVHITDSILQNGSWWDVVERFNYYDAPFKLEFADGTYIWMYHGYQVSYELTPHLFNCRTNRRLIDESKKRWITRSAAGEKGVNNVSWYNAGRETWPLVANKIAAQPRYKLRRYPALPDWFTLYPNSLVIDGEINTNPGRGTDMLIDAFCFRGSETYLRNTAGEWYLGETFVDVPAGAASMYHYRCYVSTPGSLSPWMDWDCRSPLPTWQRM